MIGFLIGLFTGTFLGVMIMCFCNVASKADKEIEKTVKNHSGNNNFSKSGN